MSNIPPQFTPSELHEWQQSLEEADCHNIFCHCRECGSEWVKSKRKPVVVAARVWNILLVGSFQMVENLQGANLSILVPDIFSEVTKFINVCQVSY